MNVIPDVIRDLKSIIMEKKEEVVCPECLKVVEQEELDMFGGLCEECAESLAQSQG